MKIYIVGSIKIDSKWRKRLFKYNLFSIEPISSLISWNFNIAGKYADLARQEIIKRYPQARITSNDDASYYHIVKAQLSAFTGQRSDLPLFFWQEDHWFICPDKNLFLYLLNEFKKSKADILRISHLVDVWESHYVHNMITNKYLYKEYLIDLDSQREFFRKNPDSTLTSLPGIYKKDIALGILENNKSLLENKKNSKGFELSGKKAGEFSAKRSFIEMVPTFHVFREVSRFNQEQRAMNMKEALQIIRLRENQERLQYFGIWTKIINMILRPRVTGGIIKRKIKKLIWKNHLFLL